MADGVMKFGVGQPIRRREDDRFLRGAGRYVDDITLPDQTYAYFLRSPYAHARLDGVDVSEAREAPGVLAVYTHEDIDGFGLRDLTNKAAITNEDGSPIAPVTMPALAKDRLRFVGQPIVAIIAESLAEARDAADLIMIDAEELPVAASTEDALAEGAPQLHDEAPGNISYRWAVGDAEKTEAAFAEAAHRVALTVINQRVIVNAIEPRAVNASFEAETGRWTIYCVSQGPHSMKANIAGILGVDRERLRVVTPDVGGGFGMKLMLHPEYPVVAKAAEVLGRPVKWTADRSESFLSDAQARDLETEAEGAFDAEGRILGLRTRSISSLGAYYSQVGAAIHTIFSAMLLGGLYKTPTIRAETVGVFTNTTPTDAYRGAGRPEISNVTERLMDAAARQIGLDPAEIRRRNLLTAADMPYTAPAGHVIDSGDCVKTLEMLLEAGDYAGAAARREEAKARGKTLGVGLCYYVERTGGGPIENARLKVRSDGTIDAWIGTQSTGQGHETAWSQLIHQKLGVDPSAINFLDGDSDMLPTGGGTGGSRSTIVAHQVFNLASDDVIEKGRAAAAEILEAAVADIEFSAQEGGMFRIAGTDRTVDLFAAAAAAEAADGADAGEILGIGGIETQSSTFPNGSHLVEAELDPATGEVKLVRYTVVDDMGAILNPLLVEGQIHGGAAQGLGQVLFESARWDRETGQPLTGSYMDYQMPRAEDVPFISVTLSEHAPTPSNPMGVKGCGEAGSLGAISATSMAVLDALRQHGVEQLEPPYTPLRLWQALQAAGED